MTGLDSKLQATIGGLSVTGVLEDFSLYVFHPYGGKQRGATGAPYLATSPLAALTDSERKDSLSVMVEFVKFHISRSRKINFKPETNAKMKSANTADSAKAIIRFSSKIWFCLLIIALLFFFEFFVHRKCPNICMLFIVLFIF